ncbi:helix-turn-helix domain-containing protein [Chitinasiproducens palmae]|uniref:Helix-turn-helix domain-containing protein n=1 Tax=Chitinasiproducens palmae TaxID=1770053 RepID=A0A1H2PPK6_9BURK|nr:helix-turn-helix domain-containing protein [Chitinasiproducens palmae]SDV48692.1 Helix-turn-helix domain-containing protein [Chitinasiproducens palmae]
MTTHDIPLSRFADAVAISDLPALARLVVLAIRKYANRWEDSCFPSEQQLCADTGLCDKTVRKYLAHAVRAGWITRQRKRNYRQQWAQTFYYLHIPAVVAARLMGVARARAAKRVQEVRVDHAVFSTLADGSHSLALPPEHEGCEAASVSECCQSATVTFAAESGKFDDDAVGQFVEDSHRNELPTNTPRIRETKNPSLLEPINVNEGKGGERERLDVDGTNALAEAMTRYMVTHRPEAPEPSVQRWAWELARGLTEERTPQRAAVLFRWAINDRFWRNIVLSPRKLFQHWDNIRLRRLAYLETKAKPGSATSQSSAAAGGSPVVDDRVCAHVGQDGVRCGCRATVVIGAGAKRRGYCSTHSRLYED